MTNEKGLTEGWRVVRECNGCMHPPYDMGKASVVLSVYICFGFMLIKPILPVLWRNWINFFT